MQENENQELMLGYNNPSQFNNWEFSFDEEIREPSYYRNLVAILSSVGLGDTVTFIFNSVGGYADGMKTILAAMDLCEVPIHGILAGDASSAASMLFLNCDSWQVSENAEMLIHNGSNGIGGKASDVLKQAEHYKRSMQQMFYRYYSGFMTDEEIEMVLNGGDLWLVAEDINERIKRLVDKRNDEYTCDCDNCETQPEESPHKDYIGTDIYVGDIVVVHKYSKKVPFQTGHVVRVDAHEIVVNVHGEEKTFKDGLSMIVTGELENE